MVNWNDATNPLTEDIDYIDVTNEAINPNIKLIEENIKVDGRDYKLANITSVEGFTNSFSIGYKPDFTVE